MATQPKWRVETEKRLAVEAELKALKERIPVVLAECVDEYNLSDTLCIDGLQDFCSRLGAAEYRPAVKGTIVVQFDNIDIPGEVRGVYGIELTDDSLEHDLEVAFNDVMAKRLPKASWDNLTITFER